VVAERVKQLKGGNRVEVPASQDLIAVLGPYLGVHETGSSSDNPEAVLIESLFTEKGTQSSQET
jgi:hypothetical protein